jgi:Peptidase A4 family
MRRSVYLLGVVILVASTNSAVAAAEGPIVHKPRIPVEAPPGTDRESWASTNWSGYALTGSGFSAAIGNWTVQAVSRSNRPTFSSQWVGIDGFNNSSLIQTGTESDFYNGQAHYHAWWEILPAAETVITTITVHPGDHMRASITLNSGTSWTIRIANTTTGRSFSTVRTYTGPRTSVEWIEEAPIVGGHVATLANYGRTTFDPGSVNGRNPRLTASESGVMVQRNQRVSTPSTPDSDRDGFNTAYGSTAPPAPPS